MVDRTIEAFEFKWPRPRTVGMLILLIIIFIVVWGTFVIIPARHRGVALWWGECGEENHGGGAQLQGAHCRKSHQG